RLLQGDQRAHRSAPSPRSLRRQGDHRRHRCAGRGELPGERERRDGDRPGQPHGHHPGQRARLRERAQQARDPPGVSPGRRAGRTVRKEATVALFPGDGIGPEVTGEAVAVLEAVVPRHDVRLTFSSGMIGGAAIDATGQPLPPAELDRARSADAVLLGAVGGPKWDDPKASVRPEQALLGLRKGLGVYANLRPVWTVPALVGSSTLRPETLKGVDLVVVRELTGGIYFGQPSERRGRPPEREAVDTMIYSEQEIARLLHDAFALARHRPGQRAARAQANGRPPPPPSRPAPHDGERPDP